MAVNIYVLTAGGRLEKYKDRIMKVARESVKIIKKKIPIPDVDIVFYDNPEYAIPHLGIGGFNQNDNLIFVYLNPKFKNFKKTINDEMIRIIAHELYHIARWKAVGFRETLLKALVNEGLADHFELEVTNKKPQKWDTALTKKQFGVMKKRAKKEFNNKNYNHEEWFFGSKEKGIPKWAGYTIGFNLVGEYLKKHPGKKPSQLFAAKAEEFAK
ncbi:MAG: DUF2268 domain-containing putative Zn-dependent protease [Candidatus Aenigmatarchaeota archaeon]